MPDPQRPLKVFPSTSLRTSLCHVSADKPAARDLYNRLTADGVGAWLDKEKLLSSQDWEAEIRKAVHESKAWLVLAVK